MGRSNVLNRQQEEIVADLKGIKMVVSGPGTGKTTTVCHYLTEIIRSGQAKPEEILALTFTNKAAGEMRERVAKMVGLSPQISTIHSFAAVVLREFPPPGYTSDFRIINELEQYTIISKLTKELKSELHPRYIVEKLTLARSLRDRKMLADLELEEIYRNYILLMRKNNTIDYDDLLTWCAYVLENNSRALISCQQRYKFVLVDEFQDINPVQYGILKLLVGKNRNFLVVGDFDQSIYRFRGADLHIMLDLEQDFSETKVYFLEENYRSTQNIVNAASSVIKNNQQRKRKKLWTKRELGDYLSCLTASDEKKEALLLADIINNGIKHGSNYSDFAILYRIHTLSRAIEEVFSAKGIPYQVLGGTGFFQRREIQNIIAFFRLKDDLEDEEALERAVALLAQINGIPVYKSEGLLIGKVQDLVANLSNTVSLEALYEQIMVETNYAAFLAKDKSSEGEKRRESLEQLRSTFREFDQDKKTLAEFLAFVAQVHTAEELDSVKLLTVHAAKGTEFKTVFVIGADSGMFPHYNAETSEDIEEERRLFYVAMTRAKDKLYLSYPESRMSKGKKIKVQPSPFLEEISPESFGNIDNRKKDSKTAQNKGIGREIPRLTMGQVKKGLSVYHSNFGEGVIITIGEAGDFGTEVVIRFADRERKIILELAPLSIV